MNSALAIASVVIKESYRRKDFYVLFVLTAVLTLTLGSASFFNDKSIVRYLKEVCLLFIWISALVIAVGTSARQIPAERENRTIFPLLAKPISRAQLIAGKFLGCWLAWGLALLGSVVFAAPSSNATICLVVIVGILLLGRHLNKVALQMAEPMSTVVYTI